MSEIATSFHFWCSDAKDLREYLLRVGVSARIVASNAHWTCIVPFSRDDDVSLMSRWAGIVMKWSYYEDYGLSLDFYHREQRLGEASFIWGMDLTDQSPGGTFPDTLRAELIGGGLLTTGNAQAISTLIEEITRGTAAGRTVRDRMGTLLRLPAFQFLSPEACLQVSLEDTRRAYPGAEDVDVT